MSRPADVAALREDEWKQLEARLDEYSRAWQKSATVEIARFLPPPADRLRSVYLREFIKTDIEFHWRHGQPVCLEVYLKDFPELKDQPECLPDLLFEEFRVRQRHGDRPELTAYKVRFPEYFQELERRVNNRLSTNVQGPLGTPAASLEAGKGSTLPVGGGYRLLDRIGSGGFGEVWKAEAPGGVPVAVKIIFRPLDHAEAKQEFEALQLIRALHHLFLLQTHSFWPLADRLIIVMDLADGSLRDRLKECRRTGLPGIPLDELVSYFREAAEALDYLHEKSVLHRDIKPDNILLLGRHARLADFGLARLGAAERSFTATSAGTPPYMAPEVWRNRVSPASDQYALAVSYAEIRLQRRPFQGHDMVEIMLQHLERPPDLSPMPPAEQQAVLRALAKKPEDRYPTCLAFWQALQQAVAPAPQPSARLVTPAATVSVPAQAPPSAASGSLGMTALPGPATPPPTPATVRTGGLARPPQAGSSLLHTALPPASGAAPPTPAGHAPRPVAWKPPEKPPSRAWRWLVGVGLAGLCTAAALVALLGPWPDHHGSGTHRDTSIADGTAKKRDTDRQTKHVEPERPPPEPLWMPDDFTEVSPPAQRKPIGRWAYAPEIVRRLADGTEVVFVLVPEDTGGRAVLPAFYMMRNKVCNAVFKQFADGHEAVIKEAGLRARQLAGQPVPDWHAGGLGPNNEPLGSDNGRLPVFQVNAYEAQECAHWLGGELPTFQQWEQAGGRGRNLSTPVKDSGKARNGGKGSIALSLDPKAGFIAPMEVGTATADVSVFNCCDMAGNGQEWTRTSAIKRKDVVYLTPSSDLKLPLVVCGHSYRADRLYAFDDTAEYPWSTRDPELTFRVAIPLPNNP